MFLRFCRRSRILNAMQELVLGFVDYTSGEATNWDNGRLDVVRAFERFAAASNVNQAESFLRDHVVSRHAAQQPAVADDVVASILE